MLSRKIYFIFILLGISLAILAQKPAWTEYNSRIEMYPENEFLVGFVSGVNTTDEEQGKLKTIYETIAKDKVIQSIQVEIESNNSLNISNVNGKSGEEFLSKSVSFSKANVAGLITQSYYDRKKKEVFAIAFVNKKELAFYYRNIIKASKEDVEQKLREGREYAKKGKKELALKSYYEAMPLLMNVDEARALLISLNRKMYADINMDEINNLNLELNNEIVSLLNPTDLSLSETAYFVAYGLFLQLGEIEGKIFLVEFSYENTGLGSNLTNKWNQEFAAALVSTANYEVQKGSGENTNLTVTGNYWKEGNFIKITASASKNDKLLAVSKGSIPIAWLENENVDFLPEQIKLMDVLKDYQLSVVSSPSSIKLGMATTIPVEIEISENNKLPATPVVGIPLEISNSETQDILCSSISNELGISSCYLPSIQSDKPVIRVMVSIDLSDYLNIERESFFYTIASRQNPVVPIIIDLATEKPTIYIKSEELIQGKTMDIKTLDPVIKESLAEKGYNFVDNKTDADYIITINANTTTGSQYQGIYFAFLDINLSIIETSTSEEIYKTHIDQIKGGGSDYTKAGKKAYFLGSERLKESLKDFAVSK
ncbi:MAG: hypothetical protein HQ521_00880 [Bacteroidetes bacterium]|nr:hypothetical protein [Bacteroidota bacterium]